MWKESGEETTGEEKLKEWVQEMYWVHLFVSELR